MQNFPKTNTSYPLILGGTKQFLVKFCVHASTLRQSEIKIDFFTIKNTFRNYKLCRHPTINIAARGPCASHLIF